MIDHLSYSSINLYLQCPAQWRFKYLQGLPITSTPALVFGSAWHNTVESYLQDRSDILGKWSAAWSKALETTSGVEWNSDTPESHHNEGVRMLRDPDVISLIESLRPKRTDVGYEIERKIELRVPGVPIPVIGFIDVITEDGIPGDFKTASRAWAADRAASEIQPLFYLAALNQAGIQTPGLRFRHFIFVKTKKPQTQVLESTYRTGEMIWLFQVIRNVWDAIDQGIYPENPGACCNWGRLCDFYSHCRGKYT